MKLKKSFEQAICILLMLALSKDQEPLPSYLISKRLRVSDSYLKKVLHQLVTAKLISSGTGKNGGFGLNKNIERISLLDVYQAIEKDEPIVQVTGLAQYVFFDDQYVKEKEQEIVHQFDTVNQAFRNALKRQTLGTLLQNPDGTRRNPINWKQIMNMENKLND